MARKKFQGGVVRSKLSTPTNTTNPLPQQVRKQVTGQVRASGISTFLYQDRQTQKARRSQTWVWDAGGEV